MEPQDRGVYNRSIQGGKWFLMNVFAQKVIQFGTFFILARLLDPRDYGVIGVMLIVHGLLDQFTNPAFGHALTREKKSIEQALDPYWTFEIIRYAVLAGALWIAAGWLGGFFHLNGMETSLLRWSGVLLLIPAFGNVRQLYFLKELQFEKVFIRDVTVQLAYTAAAVSYAFFIHPTAWALFFAYIISALVSNVLTYALHPSRPRFDFGFQRLREYVGYSKWVYGQNVMGVLSAQLDKVLVGRWLDPESLGLYTRGKDLASTTTAIMASMLSKVGFSAFAKVQDQMEKVRQGFLKSIDVLLIASLPITLILLLEGGLIVNLLLGDKWHGLVLPLKIFAFGNLFLAFVQVVNPVLSALGRPDVNFKTNALQTLMSIPLMYLGYRYYGLPGLAGGVVVAWIFLLIYVMLRARPVLNIAARAFLPTIISGTIATVGVFLIDVIGRSTIHALANPVISLLWIALLGGVYFVCVYLVGRHRPSGPWATLLSIWGSLRGRV